MSPRKRLQAAMSVLQPGVELLERRTHFAVGGLDPTFGTGGVVYTRFPNSLPDEPRADEGTCVAPATDGKLVVVGTTNQVFDGMATSNATVG